MQARRLTAALLAAAALPLAACAGPAETARPSVPTASTPPTLDRSPPPSQPATSAPAPSRPGVLPDLEVDDVTRGGKVNLASLVPSAQPLLVWFWAPH